MILIYGKRYNETFFLQFHNKIVVLLYKIEPTIKKEFAQKMIFLFKASKSPISVKLKLNISQDDLTTHRLVKYIYFSIVTMCALCNFFEGMFLQTKICPFASYAKAVVALVMPSFANVKSTRIEN